MQRTTIILPAALKQLAADRRFTDCISFVLMRRFRIHTAFTFDRHFGQAGFRMLGAAQDPIRS